jgi:hypothetical protein
MFRSGLLAIVTTNLSRSDHLHPQEVARAVRAGMSALLAWVTRIAVPFLAASLLAACGGQGTLGKKALSQEAKGIESLAAEGGLLAGDAARGRSTSTFTRIHARFLRDAARTSAGTLQRGRTSKARRLANLADRVGNDLERLSRSRSDRDLQRLLQHDLILAGDATKRLDRSL